MLMLVLEKCCGICCCWAVMIPFIALFIWAYFKACGKGGTINGMNAEEWQEYQRLKKGR